MFGTFQVTVRDEFGDAVLEFDNNSAALQIGVPDGRYVLTVECAGKRRRFKVLVAGGSLARALPLPS